MSFRFLFSENTLLGQSEERKVAYSAWWNSLGSDVLVALASLILILDDILLLQLAHALDFVEVHDEALFV